MSRFAPKFGFIAVLTLVVLSYQNCGKMSAADRAAITNSPQGTLSTPQDFMAMESGQTYELQKDINLGGQVIDKTFSGVKLIGNGHVISGILAQCRLPTDCKVNSGRDFYVSSLSFDESEISDVTFSIVADISKFPTVNDDITAINYAAFERSKVSNVTLLESITGTHPHQSGDNRFSVSGLSTQGSTLDDVTVRLTGDITLSSEMFLGFSTVGEIWGSTLTRVDAQSNITVRPLVADTVLNFDAVSSLNGATIQNSTIDDTYSVIAGGRATQTSVAGSFYPMGNILNTNIRTQTNFTPDEVDLLSDANNPSYPFDMTGSQHIHTVVP